MTAADRLTDKAGGVVLLADRTFQSTAGTVHINHKTRNTLAFLSDVVVNFVDVAHNLTFEGQNTEGSARRTWQSAAESIWIEHVARVAVAFVGTVDEHVGSTNGLANVDSEVNCRA